MHPDPHRSAAPVRVLLVCLLLATHLAAGQRSDSQPPADAEPIRATPNPQAEQALEAADLPDDFILELFAAEPLLENPVAIDVDPHGNVYVAETHRIDRGVSDNRRSEFWLDDDLAAMTVDDRLAYYRKWADRGERPADWYTQHTERLRLLIDETGDGHADRAHTFAEGFDDPLHGLAAGVLAVGDDVYFANIPHLYRLRDTTGDHHADRRDVLHRGYGVRTAFYGHDLHGLTLAPDGRLYFSVGDRGYHIELDNGDTLTDPLDPGRGAVFRCELDGSNLEVVYRGLRNPQDLAFDRYGNLFTVDNDADGVDRSRIVYLLEGGDAGWSMNFQYLEQRGPWERERLWEKANDDQPAWILPPLDYLSAGPSGFEYHPGLAALPDRYDGYFFLVDFRGNPANSGIHAFTLNQSGAAFELSDPHQFIWNILPTDIKFGYDGQLYIADWKTGWGIRDPKVGRVFRAAYRPAADDPQLEALGDLARDDFTAKSTDELIDLLAHADMRIRLRAQLALADRIDTDDAADPLRTLAANDQLDFLPARLHAVWAMGQLLRAGHTFVLDDLLDRLADDDHHVRAQAAKVIGDAAASPAAGPDVRRLLRENEGVQALIDLLADESPHVQALAAIALGKVGDEAAFEPLLRLIHHNDDADRHLRHAAVTGLFGTTDADALVDRAATASPPQRLAIVLALRRHADARLADFLDDAEPHIVHEAALAIYDLHINEAFPALAAMLDRYTRRPSQTPQQQMTFERRFYRGIPGADVDDLRQADAFPDEPDHTDHTATLTIPADHDDHYGTRITGHLVPPESGTYVFKVAADDAAELFLSTSESREDKQLIASVPSWTGPDEYDKHPEQTSEPIELEAGRRYYLELLHKEHEGGDHLNVAWRLPGTDRPRVVGAATPDAATEMLRRVINANLALGTREHAERVARFAADVTQPPELRAEALTVLEHWTDPPQRDRVLNYHRPLAERDGQIVREALEPLIVTLVDHATGPLQAQATELATELDLALDEQTLMQRLADADQPVETRISVLRSLIRSNAPRAREAIGNALESDTPLLRAEGRRMLASRDTTAGLAALREALADGETVEQQQALTALGELDHDGADEVLADWLDDLLAGNVRRALQLELIEAARQRRSEAIDTRLAEYEASLDDDDPLDRYGPTLRGGDADAGRNVFFSHPAAQCIRCHTIDGVGGDAGPDLTGVGSRRGRSQLLADLVTPNEDIAEGFGTVVLTLENEQVLAGTLRDETDDTLTLLTADGQLHTVDLDDIASRTPAVSAMPPVGDVLSPRELRDLIEFLATHEDPDLD